MPTSLAFDRQKSSDPANFPQEHGPLSHASGWKSPADTGCLADKIGSWMRHSWAVKKRANPPGLLGYPAVSESFFPICAKRTIRFRGKQCSTTPGLRHPWRWISYQGSSFQEAKQIHGYFQQQLLLYLPPVGAGSFLVKLQLLFMHFTLLPMERGGLSDRGQGSHN